MVPDSLIKQYAGGNLIPIIGCEMMMINQPGDKQINIHDYIILKQFKKTEDFPSPPENFYDLQLIDPQFNQNYIIGFLQNIKESEKDISLLDKLSRMKKFRLFIMASMFKDFEDVLIENNPGEQFEIFKNDSNNSSALTNIDFVDKMRKLVYLFDKEDSPMFAINDEDRLEYLFSLAKTSSLQKSLVSFLAGKTLLFLGCDFSDWFMRYCIRVLYNLPYEKGPRVYIINDSTNPLNFQELFFKKHKIELIHQYPVKKFIDEFYSKVMGAQEFEDKFNGKRVFISYSKHDKEAAKNVNDCLNNKGLGTWFDDHDREIGPHVTIIQKQIMDAAVTRVMICVISAKLIAETKNQDVRSYVRDIEWDAASIRIRAAKMKNEADKFGIVPYFVDDPSSYLSDLPDFIAANFRFGELIGGCDDLFEEIKDYLK